MKKITATLATLFLFALGAFAQNEEPKVSKHLVGVYVIPLKASYEIGLGNSNSLELSAGVTGSSKLENENLRFSLVPIAEGAYKYYYNLNKRQLKGKHTALNSGNFWGLNARYQFKAISDNGDDFSSVFISPMWGIQRNYDSRISLGIRLGYGVVITKDNSYLSPFINFKLGFVLYASQ